MTCCDDLVTSVSAPQELCTPVSPESWKHDAPPAAQHVTRSGIKRERTSRETDG